MNQGLAYSKLKVCHFLMCEKGGGDSRQSVTRGRERVNNVDILSDIFFEWPLTSLHLHATFSQENSSSSCSSSIYFLQQYIFTEFYNKSKEHESIGATRTGANKKN